MWSTRHRRVFVTLVALAAGFGVALLLTVLTSGATGTHGTFHVRGKTAAGSVSPGPALAAMSEIDQALHALPVGNVAFNTPTKMVRGEPTAVELKVSRHRQAVITITAPGQIVVTKHVRLSDEMKASLTGLGFNISSSDNPVQLVSLARPTAWHWQVEPTRNGSLRLDLALLALVKINHRTSGFYPVRTLHRTWNVDVTWNARVTSFLGTNWQWLWAFILVPVVGFVWRRRGARRETGKPGAHT